MSSRQLELPASLKRRLLHLRQLTGTLTPPELPAESVAEVESTLGMTLGDPLLALLANRDDATLSREIRLRNLASHTRELRDLGGPRGLVGVGRDPAGAYLIACPLMGLWIHEIEFESGITRQRTTQEWLDELIAAEIEKLRDIESDEKARVFKVVGEAEVDAFTPAVVVDESPKAKVEHPKFGAGEVIQELDAGSKLVIRFADGQTRTLLARFVKRAGDDSEP
ncbi:MAG: hypothetical protein AAGE52_22280 [Myxococcota bacterium]